MRLRNQQDTPHHNIVVCGSSTKLKIGKQQENSLRSICLQQLSAVNTVLAEHKICLFSQQNFLKPVHVLIFQKKNYSTYFFHFLTFSFFFFYFLGTCGLTQDVHHTILMVILKNITILKRNSMLVQRPLRIDIRPLGPARQFDL